MANCGIRTIDHRVSQAWETEKGRLKHDRRKSQVSALFPRFSLWIDIFPAPLARRRWSPLLFLWKAPDMEKNYITSQIWDSRRTTLTWITKNLPHPENLACITPLSMAGVHYFRESERLMTVINQLACLRLWRAEGSINPHLLARKTGIPSTTVYRVFDGSASPSFDVVHRLYVAALEVKEGRKDKEPKLNQK